MSAFYAIFGAEFKTSLRRNFQSFKKRLTATIIISILVLIFSLACIRLLKFVIDNPELFPEGSNEGYGTILLVYFALFTLRSAGITYRKVIKSKIMDIYLVQPILPKQIMLGLFFSILVPNIILLLIFLSIFILGNFITNTNIILELDFLILIFSIYS